MFCVAFILLGRGKGRGEVVGMLCLAFFFSFFDGFHSILLVPIVMFYDYS